MFQLWKKALQPFTEIYRDVKTGAYLVQPYTEGPVAATAFGEPTVVCKENFNSQIADAILASLKKFGEDKYDRIRAIRHSPGERAQFLKRHVAVGVEELVSGGLIIRPLLHEGGGFVGLDEDFPKATYRTSLQMPSPRHSTELPEGSSC